MQTFEFATPFVQHRPFKTFHFKKVFPMAKLRHHMLVTRLKLALRRFLATCEDSDFSDESLFTGDRLSFQLKSVDHETVLNEPFYR